MVRRFANREVACGFGDRFYAVLERRSALGGQELESQRRIKSFRFDFVVPITESHWPKRLTIVMPTEIFRSSRWTRGNRLFPTYIEVSDKSVSRRKRSWFRMDEISISLSKVASVHIKTGLIWSDILIESSGGSDPLASHGHSKGDALRIKQLIETAQTQLARNPSGES